MVQTASVRPFIAEIWVRSRPSPCVIIGTQSGTGQGFLPARLFPPSVSLHQCSMFIVVQIFMSSEEWADEAWKPSNKAVLFRISGRPLGRRVSSHFLTCNDVYQALVCPPSALFRGHLWLFCTTSTKPVCRVQHGGEGR
jgi:hypothetical protein